MGIHSYSKGRHKKKKKKKKKKKGRGGGRGGGQVKLCVYSSMQLFQACSTFMAISTNLVQFALCEF